MEMILISKSCEKTELKPMPIYMKFEGISGNVKTGSHKGWIELQSCQIGTNRQVTAPGIGASRENSAPSVSEIAVTKFQDDTSARLFQESLNGEPKKVTIDFVDKDGNIYLSLELESTLISSYAISGNGIKPTENLSLNFTQISYTAKATTKPKNAKDDKVKAAWGSEISKSQSYG